MASPPPWWRNGRMPAPCQWAQGLKRLSKRSKIPGAGHPIARRDFLQGAAITTLAAGLAPELAAAAETEKLAQNDPSYYPPTRLGLRGSHPGSFEAAHEVRDGDFWHGATALHDTGEEFDLIVVGGGISGLSAAYFYRQAKPNAKILILDNHDDFGGHAKRNEFTVSGHTYLLNGGTLEIDSPYPYSKVADGLLKSLGVEPEALEKACNKPEIYKSLQRATFFDRETFGTDALVVGQPKSEKDWRDFLAKTPLSDKARQSILRIETGAIDPLPGLSNGEKRDR